MGAGASIEIPEQIDLATFQRLAGDRFDEDIFDENKDENGLIPRDRLLQLSQLTDCFLTHDWGADELGRSNHERVARVNESLKARGFVTWFDSERMIGNIVQQMCNGIDCAKVIVVFITKNYVEKVGGENANDNCQLEFNYALRQRSSKYMVPVVMEDRMRNPNTWRGAVGMALGGSLYVDLVEDADWEAKCDQLAGMITTLLRPSRRQRTTGTGKAPIPSGPSSRPISSIAYARNRPLADLTTEDMSILLWHLRLVEYIKPLSAKKVDGITLAYVASDEELVQLGVSLAPKARMLFAKIQVFKSSGVPEEMLQRPTAKAAETPSPTASLDPSPASATHIPEKAANLEVQAIETINNLLLRSPTATGIMDVTNHELIAHNVMVMNATGIIGRKLNGLYIIETFDNVSGDYLHVYQKRSDPNLWIEYQHERRSWQIKTTQSRQSKSCLAEAICDPKRPLLAEKLIWNVFDGKEMFEKQTELLIYPEIHNVLVLGAHRVKAATYLNGKYLVTDQVCGGKPCFRKLGNDNMWIEYNHQRKRWQIKTAQIRNTNSCLAESNALESTFTPADINGQQWEVNDNGAFLPMPEMKVFPQPESTIISGSLGTHANKINGIYHPQFEVWDGQLVYRNGSYGDLWLEYSAKRRSWQIKTTASKHTAACIAEMQCASRYNANDWRGGFDGVWEVLTKEGQFETQLAMTLMPLPSSVVLTFPGANNDLLLMDIQGIYDATGSLRDHLPTYRRRSVARSSKTYYQLTFYTDRNQWLLFPSNAATPLLMYHAISVAPLHISQGEWRSCSTSITHVNVGERLAARLALVPPNIQVVDTTGPRAPFIVGNYDIMDEISDGFCIYKRRRALTESVALASLATDKARSTDVIIEYSLSSRSWQIKRESDRGTLKAYASLTSAEVLPIHECTGEWKVFDIEQKQWLSQPQMQCWEEIPSISISGATGSHQADINGDYDVTDASYLGLPVYQKVNNPQLIIEYNESVHSWQMKHIQDRGEKKAWAYLISIDKLPIHLCFGIWNVFDATAKWQPQETVTLRKIGIS